MKKFGGQRGGSPSADKVGAGAGSQTPTDFVVQFSDVVNSSLSSRTKMVQLSVTGIAGLNYSDNPSIPLADDKKAEATENAEQYSAPGIIGRPLPPRSIKELDYRTNVVCLRTADGLVPIAYRDLRWKMGGDGPAEGVLAFVGYGGGFHSLTPVKKGSDPAGGGTIHVIYCPYDFDSDGKARKAHTIILDPSDGNESIMIAHANGLAITMSNEGKKALLMKNAAGDATLRLDDDGVTITAEAIVLNGGVTIGNAATAVPLLAGAASPGSTKLFVSPT